MVKQHYAIHIITYWMNVKRRNLFSNIKYLNKYVYKINIYLMNFIIICYLLFFNYSCPSVADCERELLSSRTHLCALRLGLSRGPPPL